MGDFPDNRKNDGRGLGQLFLILCHLKDPIKSDGNNDSIQRRSLERVNGRKAAAGEESGGGHIFDNRQDRWKGSLETR